MDAFSQTDHYPRCCRLPHRHRPAKSSHDCVESRPFRCGYRWPGKPVGQLCWATPTLCPQEAMPMGNGRLGIAVWSADGFTAQLNREDTLPHRDSPGQLVIPGLATLTSAARFQRPSRSVQRNAGRARRRNEPHRLRSGIDRYLRRRRNRSRPEREPDCRAPPLAATHASRQRPPAKPACSHKPGSTITAPEPPEKHSAPLPPSRQRAATSLPP